MQSKLLFILSIIAIVTVACTSPTGSSVASDGASPVNPADPTTPPAPTFFELDLSGDSGTIPDGAQLEDYGFDSVANVFVTPEGYIQTMGPGGWDALSTFVTPELLIDRDASASGIEVLWEARFPATSGIRWKENNKTWISLLDATGQPTVEVLYKPNGAPSEAHSYDLALSDSAGSLGTHTTRLITGDDADTPENDAEWIAFRLVVHSTADAGGSGEIALYFDNSASPVLTATSDLDTAFHGLRFQYKTGTGDNTFYAQIRNLSVRPVENQ